MLRLYFGQPGCGKTTLACRTVFKYKKRKRYDRYFLNFPNTIGSVCNVDGLGEWTFPENSFVVIDEAGIEYNSRKFKSMSQQFISWIKLHRHYKCDVDFISQSWEDVDITIRRLADQLWYVRRLGPFTLVRRVYKFVTVDENTHQIVDGYKFGKIIKDSYHRHFMKRLGILFFALAITNISTLTKGIICLSSMNIP